MALSTANVSLGSDWSTVATGVTRCIVQNKGAQPAHIHVGTSPPSATAPFIELKIGAESSLSLTELDTETVYGRAGPGGVATVTVIKG